VLTQKEVRGRRAKYALRIHSIGSGECTRSLYAQHEGAADWPSKGNDMHAMHLVFWSHVMMHYDREPRLWNSLRSAAAASRRLLVISITIHLLRSTHQTRVASSSSVARLRYCGSRFPDLCPAPAAGTDTDLVRSFSESPRHASSKNILHSRLSPNRPLSHARTLRIANRMRV